MDVDYISHRVSKIIRSVDMKTYRAWRGGGGTPGIRNLIAVESRFKNMQLNKLQVCLVCYIHNCIAVGSPRSLSREPPSPHEPRRTHLGLAYVSLITKG